MLINGVDLMHRLNRCMLRLQRRMLEEKQLISPDQLMQPKNSVEAIHRLFQDLLQSLRKLSSSYDLPSYLQKVLLKDLQVCLSMK